MTLDPHFKAHLDAQAAAAPAGGGPPIAAMPPALVRAGYRAQRTAQNVGSIPPGVEVRDLEVAGGDGPVPARLYTPAGAANPSGLLVYFHGGGFVIGDLETHDAHCRRLAAFSGQRVMAVDYRLAPENPFPAGHDDALAATRWAFDHAAELGADPAHIGVGGDSAGGNLAASIALDLRGDDLYPLKLQLLLYPALWPAEETASRQERDGPVLSKAAMAFFEASLAFAGHPMAHRVSPAQAKDLSGLPRAYIVTAGHDPLEHEGRDYAAALAAAGTPAHHANYPTLVHDFFIMGDVSPAVIEAAKEAGAAVKDALG
ncbi:MAG TPA: alpha/beta hydrolase [Caulobacteraceae bacterium]|jgi:acetyl esterase|nr:alpha/beta hydrolase [Caulobacteraceae bacterium]